MRAQVGQASGGRIVAASDSNGNELKDGDTLVVITTCLLKKA